jgi:hypothetical protein
VDVRLIERSGEVRVAVRTPDAQLAGDLRANLSTLATRLEQSGFRAETWHPAIFHESRRYVEATLPPANSSHNQDGSQQGGQRQPEPRQQRHSTAHAAKSQQKEFRWFISQLH